MATAWIDLSYPFYSGMPYPHYFYPPKIRRLMDLSKDPMNVTECSFVAHTGTHVDAPVHFIPNGKTIGDLSIEQWIGDGVIVDLPKGRFGEVGAADLQAQGGEVRPGDMLLLRTGWGRHYGDEMYYEHPYLTEDAARWLLDRGVRALGMDFMTPEVPIDVRKPGFNWPVHRLLLAQECLIMENVRLADVPAGRLFVIACPVNIRDSDGAPARIIARR